VSKSVLDHSSRQLVNRLALPIYSLLAPQLRLVDLEQPALLVLNFALLDAFQGLQELDANRAGFAGRVLVSELLALGLVCDGFDRNESRRGTSSENFLEVVEFRVRDL
jgi:hypothetical protein